MIKFFRKIRQNLLARAKTATYFKYAVGEIVLVVIGILIALQINNWNEENKSRQRGNEILKEIKENLSYNSLQFQNEIETEYEVINSIDVILDNINNRKIYNDSLDKHYRFATYWSSARWKSSGYESMLSKGSELSILRNVREAIIDLYQITYALISEDIRLAENNFSATILPLWLEFFERKSVGLNNAQNEIAKPFDYQKVITSEKLKSTLTFLRSNRVTGINVRLEAIEKNEELIAVIDSVLVD